jgi:predicted lipid-binding transport protein (Tim44 family)
MQTDKADKSGQKKLTHVPGQAARFVAEMKARKLHWAVPDDWMNREEMDVAERIINQAKENLKDLQKAFTTGTLKVVRHV